MKRYKIAVMGAPSAGKTTFFASFYCLTQIGKNWDVHFKDPQTQERLVSDLISGKCAEKTRMRECMSFALKSLGLCLDVDDIPGKYSQSMELWEENAITRDLATAHAILFFISAEDVMFYQDRILEDNMVFASALSRLKEIRRKQGGRTAIPLFFIFTKGDLVPDISLATLKERLPGLLKIAGETGCSVHCWKVSSVPSFSFLNKPAKNDDSENATEVMEKVLRATSHIYDSFHRRLKNTAIAALFIVGSIGLAFANFGAEFHLDSAESALEPPKIQRVSTVGRSLQVAAVTSGRALSLLSKKSSFTLLGKDIPRELSNTESEEGAFLETAERKVTVAEKSSEKKKSPFTWLWQAINNK